MPPINKLVSAGFWILFSGLLHATGLTPIHYSPPQPHSGEAVEVIAMLPPDITRAALEYQIVEPGKYIELKEPAYKTSWSSIPMSKDKDEFKASLPGEIQKHRRLIRYRVTTSGTGKQLQWPEATDAQPNLAYFVYDGVPSWRGAIEPGSTDPARSRPIEFSSKALERLPVYHLIGKKGSVEASTWGEQYRGKEYKWSGTMVYEGKVYDHIHFRSRGGTWRYAMGKNMWKFEFNKGHDFEARDNYGHLYSVPWSKLNLGACIQQGQYGHRGEHGMFEAVAFKLFNLAGVEAPNTHWVHFRIIDEPNEADPRNQYAGDFWGVYLAVEEMGGRFLKEHHLPNGNLFKMEGGTGELKNSGTGGLTNKQDLNKFLAAYNGGNPPDEWWRSNFDLPRYYNYRSIVEGIHHYDIAEGKNYFYLLDPQTGRWSVHPWDVDLTWANNMYGSGDEPFKSRVLPRPAFRLEYQNRLREIRDLLFNTSQTWFLIDEFARLLTGGEQEATSIVAADRARWDYHPVMAASGNAGQGGFYRASSTRDFAGMVQLMKAFVRKRSTWIDTILLKDPQLPATPKLSYSGSADFSKLTFDLADNPAADRFAAVQWRVAATGGPTALSVSNAIPYRYEILPLWQSAELKQVDPHFTFPPLSLDADAAYRVRARVKDDTGRWSHWSAPFEFVKGGVPGK